MGASIPEMKVTTDKVIHITVKPAPPEPEITVAPDAESVGDDPETDVEEKGSRDDLHRAQTDGRVLRNFRPLVMTLYVGGLRWDGLQGARRAGARVYATCVLVAMVTAACRMFSVFAVIDSRRLSNATFTVCLLGALWISLCVTNAAVLYVISWQGRTVALLRRLEALAASGSVLRHDKVKRYMTAVVVVAVVVVVVNNTLFLVLTLHSDLFRLMMLHPASVPDVPLAALFYVIYAYANVTWMFPLIYACAIIAAFIVLFKEHNDALDAHIGTGLSEDGLEASRLHFNVLCDVINDADAVCAPLNGVNYTLNVAVVLMLLYSGIFTEEESLGGLHYSVWVAVVVVWVVVCTAYLALPSVLGSVLNYHAHSCADTLHKINFLSDAGRTVKGQVSIYLAKLISGKIGVSVLHMFTLDKEAILTILGFVVTYFILLVQFGMMSPGCTSKCSDCVTPNASVTGG